MQDKNTTSVYNENIVQEIMVLVGEYGVMVKYEQFDECDDLYSEIESNIRELVENSSSVREPLSDEQMETLIEKHAPPIHPDFSEDDDFEELTRAIEAAHNITKDS